uniref:glucagon receptor isoform X3 n=1 Tax=Callithrix jacchus TaxID=9483 RepID=UPI00159E6572|nr:glucagon receptor isoform X3 [Callithrix jacchus]
MPLFQPRQPLLLLLLLVCQPQAPSAQVMDFLFEKWKLYSDQCHHNLSLLPPPTELVCNRTFDKYSCWPDTPPNTTANISCPWYLPWHHKEGGGQDVQQLPGNVHGGLQPIPGSPAPRLGPPGGPQVGSRQHPGRLERAGRREMLTVCPHSKLHCTRNAIHANLFASFVLKAGSVLVIDGLLRTRYSQKIGDDLSVSIWLSDGVSPPPQVAPQRQVGGWAGGHVATLTLHLCQAVAGCRVAAVFMHYGIVANYCWLLVEGLYLHSLLGLATLPKRSFFRLYLGIGWGAPMLFVIPWAVVKCLFENIQCWTSNDNMGFWWILRFPVFLAILINLFIFIRVVHLLVAKLRARQMHHTDYKFRLAKSTLTLIPLLGVHEVVFAFVTDEHAHGTLRSAKLFFDLFLSSFQGLLVAVLYCFLNKELPRAICRPPSRLKQEEMSLNIATSPGEGAVPDVSALHSRHATQKGPAHAGPRATMWWGSTLLASQLPCGGGAPCLPAREHQERAASCTQEVLQGGGSHCLGHTLSLRSPGPHSRGGDKSSVDAHEISPPGGPCNRRCETC